MLTVIIPIVLLIVLIFAKKIPFVGGKIAWALIIAGITALLLGGIYNPVEWATAWANGIDRLSWIMALALFGSIYAEAQTEMKTLDLVVNLLRTVFGRSPKGLIIVVILVLGIAGSLLGDAIASATVIGILVIRILYDMGLKAEEVACVITMGAMLGSIMPPITQSVFLSASLVGIDPAAVVNVTYGTVGFAFVVCSIYAIFKFVRIDSLPEHLIPHETPREIMKGNWHIMIPLFFLIGLVVLYAAFKINLVYILIGPVIDWLSGIIIVKGIANSIVTFLIAATLASLAFSAVRKNIGKIGKQALHNAAPSLKIQLGAALLLGAFYAGGQIDVVREFAVTLAPNVVKVGGGFAMLLMAALTGSQSTAQNTIFSFFAPALMEIGVDPVHAAIAGSHIASGGQGFPPASATALVVCALVGGVLSKEVNPMKTMVLCLPMCLYLVAVGFLFMFI